MRTGFCVFLASFAAFGASWFGLVCGPVHQLNGAKETTVLQSGDKWPQQPSGAENLGAQVYRASGCAACHTEQIRQTGVMAELSLTSLGVQKPEEFKGYVRALLAIPELMGASNTIAGNIDKWNGELPAVLYGGQDPAVASMLADKLKPVGVKTDSRIVATGADIARGWGSRQSVAADYLYAAPVQLGNLRAGPDLSNIGVRAPDVNWHLQHLYAPGSLVPGSKMPAFRFLFRVQKVGLQPSPDALVLKPEFAPPAGFEVVPSAEAKQLAAYLASLKANVPLYEAPFTPVTSAK
jgi:cbb3-type cytochrome oxidase cytochrome c subunit